MKMNLLFFGDNNNNNNDEENVEIKIDGNDNSRNNADNTGDNDNNNDDNENSEEVSILNQDINIKTGYRALRFIDDLQEKIDNIILKIKNLSKIKLNYF